MPRSLKEFGVNCLSSFVAMAAMSLVLILLGVISEQAWLLGGLAIGVASALVGVEAVYRYRRSYLVPEGKRYHVEGALDELLEDLRQIWQDPAPQARAFVMLPNRAITHRKVVFRKDYKKTDPDWDLELAVHTGLSGLAWNYRTPYAEGGLRELHRKIREGRVDKATFLMQPEQAAKVRRTMDSMLAVPALSQEPEVKQIASVCVDSDEDLDTTKFDTDEVQRTVKRHASIIAGILQR